MKKIILILLLIVPLLCFGQGKVTRPKKQSNTVEQKSVPPKKQQSSSVFGKINGHDYVDLGLPSGLKWATCNVGASSPQDYGNYYAWAETKPKSFYSDSNCNTHKKSSSELKKAGIINSAGNLTLASDAARQNWGSSWRMPTFDEFVELREKCKWTWTTKSGKNGYEVTGPNGQSIFLPAAGSKWKSRFFYKGGSYWSSTLPPDDWFESAAYRLEIDLYNNDRSIWPMYGIHNSCSIKVISIVKCSVFSIITYFIVSSFDLITYTVYT